MFYIEGKQMEILCRTFSDERDAKYFFNTLTTSRVITQGFEVKESKCSSKKNKHTLTKIKNHINLRKQQEYARQRDLARGINPPEPCPGDEEKNVGQERIQESSNETGD